MGLRSKTTLAAMEIPSRPRLLPETSIAIISTRRSSTTSSDGGDEVQARQMPQTCMALKLTPNLTNAKIVRRRQARRTC